MIPADSRDIHQEYRILLKELKDYNPQLLDKKRILAISKSDLLDDELKDEIREDLPEVPWQFISAVSGEGLGSLNDRIWQELNA